MELNSLFQNSFVVSLALLNHLIRRDAARLTKEAFTSNPIRNNSLAVEKLQTEKKILRKDTLRVSEAVVWKCSVGKRSSHQRCSVKKVFLEISQNAQEITCVQVFSCEFCEISNNFFLHRTLPEVLCRKGKKLKKLL